MPGTTLASTAVSVPSDDIEGVAARLRRQPPHVIGRIQEDRLLLDPRTVLPEQAEAMLAAVIDALRE